MNSACCPKCQRCYPTDEKGTMKCPNCGTTIIIKENNKK